MDSLAALLTPFLETSRMPTLMDGLYFAVGLLIFYLVTVILKRSVGMIANLQRSVYRTQWPLGAKKFLDSLLKFIKPNSAWLLALVIYLVSTAKLPDINSGVHVFNELLLIYIAFRIILLGTVFSIKRAYSQEERYITESTMIAIYRDSTALAWQFCILLISGRYLTYYFAFDYLNDALLLLILSSSLYFYHRLLVNHQAVALRFISRHLPSKTCQWMGERYQQKTADLIFLLAYLVALITRMVLDVHQFLLLLDAYKMLSAKLLRLHLEQKQQNDDEDDETIPDTRYERWFTQAYQPPTMIVNESMKQAHEQLNGYINKWLNDKLMENDLLLTGPAGCGKSIALKTWMEEAPEILKVHYVDVPAKSLDDQAFFDLLTPILGKRVSSIDELIELDHSIEPTAIIFDNCHNIFLSDVNGFNAYKRLLDCVNAPFENLFFIVVMNDATYLYLADVFGWSQQFSYTIHLKPWKAEEIRDLIMQRHKASRRKLEFDELLFAGLGNDEISAYSATADRCFRLLWEQSHGIPALAMAIWVRAASRKERFTIEIGLPEKPSTSLLNDYPKDFLFVYSALAKHHELTHGEATCATRLPTSLTLRALKIGRDAGFLLINDEQRYYFHPLWCHSIINYLRTKNYLHGY